MSVAFSILGDWGTTRLRLFRQVDGVIVDRIDGLGIGALNIAPADALRNAIAPWCSQVQPQHILLCGMAGARSGLLEAPYADCPADAASWATQAVTLNIDDISVGIAAGLACTRSNGMPDVMRGEETQIFGVLRQYPALASGRQILVLPGTHSKWVTIEHGRVLGLQTCLSGELFALLREYSTLTRAGQDDGDDGDGFEHGLISARQHEGLVSSLFLARSAQLRAGRSRSWALAFLSGLIIGNEIEEMLAHADKATPISLIGDPALTARYLHALAGCGLSADLYDGDTCALAGLQSLKESMQWI